MRFQGLEKPPIPFSKPWKIVRIDQLAGGV
jgi:hypothetical protein